MWLTKLIGGLLMPVPVILVLLALGLLLLLATRYRRIGGLVLVAGLALFITLSLPFVPERLLSSLESRYPPLLEPPPAEWIVVLGGGVNAAPGLPAPSRLSPSSLARLAEGLRLHRLLPEATLAFSGGSFDSGVTTAEAMAQAAASLGAEAVGYELFTEPKTTAEEARAVRGRISPDDTVILVTSAYHMPRAVALFKAQGVNVVPAPAGHLVDPMRAESHIGAQLPQAGYLDFARRAFWEYLGMVYEQSREVTESGAGSREPGAGSREPRAESRG